MADANQIGCAACGASANPNEDFVQWIWREQFLNADELRCMDGRVVKVLKSGDYVGGQGPDFRNAILEIGGFRLQGDIEIHVESHDWRAHKHSCDHAYNRVVLHVFLWASDAALTDELHSGIRVPRLELGGFLEPDLETLVRCYDEDCAELPLFHSDDAPAVDDSVVPSVASGYPCHELILGWDAARREGVLRAAGRRRVETRISRFADASAGCGLEEAFWQSFLCSLTTGRSRLLMFSLASHVPFEELCANMSAVDGDQRYVRAIECVLLHTANLVPIADGSFSGDACRWLNECEVWWSKLSALYGDRVMKSSKLWHGGMRPATFPERRLAGVARLLARRRKYSGFLSWLISEVHAFRQSDPSKASDFRKVCACLIATLTVDGEDSFWGHHFSLRGKRLSSNQLLIGNAMASSLMFNVVLPFVIIHARKENDKDLEDFSLRLMAHWPTLSDNSVVRRMRERLLGAQENKPRLELHQQGLYWLSQEYCAKYPCGECPCRCGSSVFDCA